MKKSLEITTSDSVDLTDKIHTYKRWIKDIKHFWTVKIIPPTRK